MKASLSDGKKFSSQRISHVKTIKVMRRSEIDTSFTSVFTQSLNSKEEIHVNVECRTKLGEEKVQDTLGLRCERVGDFIKFIASKSIL
jgi:hypothetical protein